MTEIKEYEEILRGNRLFGCAGDNFTLFKAYRMSKNAGKSRLDFTDIIWVQDIPAIAKILRSNGIKEFTISVFATGIADALAAFQEAGIRIQGMIKAETDIRTSHWDERGRRIKSSNTINALLMKVE
ncbi:MAG: hypothetical protein IJQ58_02625 [Synergistaceae bacterium]|nr:hypothetical protein [Synergistaceae bacterium]